MTFSNEMYDRLKWIAQYLLPGMATFYFAIAKIWGLPYGAEVVGTISAIDVFLGTMLGISSSSYEGDGSMEIVTDGEYVDIKRMTLATPIENLINRNTIILKIENTQAETETEATQE